jgi:putative transposase
VSGTCHLLQVELSLLAVCRPQVATHLNRWGGGSVDFSAIHYIFSKKMQTKKYNSYSSALKLSAIRGESVNVDYNTSYYWKTKGKHKIETAQGQNEFADHMPGHIEVNAKLHALLDNLFDFFLRLIEQKQSLKKLYRKQRARIVSLVEHLKYFSTPVTACKWLGITERTYFNWKNRPACKMTYTQECPNVFPSQLTDQERQILENEYFKNERYADYPIADLYAQMLRDKKVLVSEASFYELAATLGEREKRKVLRQKRHRKGLRAENPKQILHMDKTLYPTEDGNRPWIYIVCDNRSRAILSAFAHAGSHSATAAANLKSALDEHGVSECWLVTDDGSENKGEVKKYLRGKPAIKHKIAQQDIPHSNSMVEAVIKVLKYRHLKNRHFKNLNQLKKALAKAVQEYNNRPRKIHLGKTPLEVLSGDFPDTNELRELKVQARQKRLEQNRNFNCLKAFY